MMAPTAVLRDGVAELVVGSAGSNRIRSAILQTIVRRDRRGHAGARRGRGAAGPLRGRGRVRRARTRRRASWKRPDGRSRASATATCSSGGCRPPSATVTGCSGAGATRGAAAPRSWSVREARAGLPPAPLVARRSGRSAARRMRLRRPVTRSVPADPHRAGRDAHTARQRRRHDPLRRRAHAQALRSAAAASARPCRQPRQRREARPADPAAPEQRASLHDQAPGRHDLVPRHGGGAPPGTRPSSSCSPSRRRSRPAG